MIFVDSNVFLIDLRYPRDANAAANKRFIEVLRARRDGATSVLNLLEVLGVLSFNLNERQLTNVRRLLPERYGITILPSTEGSYPLPSFTLDRMFKRICRRLSLGDAMILEHAESRELGVEAFVSWEAPHFRDSTSLAVLTPSEFLSQFVSSGRADVRG